MPSDPAVLTAIEVDILAVTGRSRCPTTPEGQLRRVRAADWSGAQVKFDLADVRRIEKRGDSLKNGAIIGAAVGLFGGVGSLVSRCRPGGVVECEDELGPVAVFAAFTAIWGAIGAGIDALIVGRTPLYQAPTGTAALELRPTSIALRVRW